MNKEKKNRVGEIHSNNQGLEFEIIDYKNSTNSTIKFKEGFIKYNVYYCDIKNKRVSNPYHPSLYGIGYLGHGNYKPTTNKNIYETWNRVLKRCYDKKYQEKQPTYKGCSVDEHWSNFQNFGKWFDVNYTEGWALDKDILVKGNKIYSPETCAFVPQEINNLFLKNNATRGEFPVGVHKQKNRYYAKICKDNKCLRLGGYNTPEEAFQVYKTAKEAWIKEVADKWKDLIDPRVYQAMYNYQVEITD